MYKRIVLKISGEALSGDQKGVTFDNSVIDELVRQIQLVIAQGTQVCLVIGGGNFWRGRSADSQMDRTKADQIGMLATVMNAIYVADALNQKGTKTVVQTPFIIGTMTEQFSKERALHHLSHGKVIIFAGGLGHPFFSTDTITALRGAELDVDCLLFAKNIDGVYDCDPATNQNAKKYEAISCQSIMAEQLKVIDMAAANLCYEKKLPILIFGLSEENSIIKAVRGEKIGTRVTV